VHGTSCVIDARGCLIHSDGPSVTVVGADDLIVIATADEILILPRGRSQDVRKAVAAMNERKREA
jgi:mannose-1-phosphate guanylyltransferase/mannose-1-phosphate guanylyltransferase/mannose-6-phosphate isomerase